MRLLRYEARGKIGKHEECVTVPRDGAVSTFNFLRALSTLQLLHVSMKSQLTPNFNLKTLKNQDP